MASHHQHVRQCLREGGDYWESAEAPAEGLDTRVGTLDNRGTEAEEETLRKLAAIIISFYLEWNER
jgi:hypothetical protein